MLGTEGECGGYLEELGASTYVGTLTHLNEPMKIRATSFGLSRGLLRKDDVIPPNVIPSPTSSSLLTTTMRFPLTGDNLRTLDPRHQVEQAKRGVREFLQSLECIGPAGQRILESERLYLDKGNQVRLRDANSPLPGSDDIAFWNAFWKGNLQRLEEQHGRTRALERVKGSVFAKMSALAVEGAHILEHDELYIAGPNHVRLRGNGVEADLDNVEYWERKYTHFEEQLFNIRQKTRGQPVAAAAAIHGEESSCEPQCLSRCASPRGQDYARIAAWTAAQPSGTPRRCSQCWVVADRL